MDYDSIKFNTDGILMVELNRKDLLDLREEIKNIKENFTKYSDSKIIGELAGNIEREYSLSVESKNKLNKLISPYVRNYEKLNPLLGDIQVLDSDLPISLKSAWVNFQKKYEFNPVHRHSGVYSFILWIEIPYYLDKEINNPSCIHSNTICAGQTEFLYTNTLGQIKTERIPVDKKYENVLVIFPAQMMHCVYPFYTSDGYRISVSGNYVLKTK